MARIEAEVLAVRQRQEREAEVWRAAQAADARRRWEAEHTWGKTLGGVAIVALGLVWVATMVWFVVTP
jgi:hypothetical protein